MAECPFRSFIFFFYIQLGLSPLLFCEDSTDKGEKESKLQAEPSHQVGEDDLYESRLCLVQKGRLGFGFNLGQSPNRPGTFISRVGTKSQNW